ncbi:MAG: hypothetical protein M1832_002755 [Thelocarpon impressellum]|nr:MAG: hypothetical protein M1832_002755 [Thelocarpon impressellum]
MKFAKELEDGLVPEWRAKYFDYKTGKKRLKAVARALRNVNATPRSLKRPSPDVSAPAASIGVSQAPVSFVDVRGRYVPHRPNVSAGSDGVSEPLRNAAPLGRDSGSRAGSVEHGEGGGYVRTPAMAIPDLFRSARDHGESQPLCGGGAEQNYGSFVPTPPDGTPPPPPSLLELPDPALDPADTASMHHARRPGDRRRGPGSAGASGNAYEVGRTHAPSESRPFSRPRRTFSTPDASHVRPFIHRILTNGGSLPRRRRDLAPRHRDVPLEAYRDFDLRQADFFAWMDGELAKIETFYKVKEDEATERLQTLRDQLHEMRNRRLEQVVEAQRHADRAKAEADAAGLPSPVETTSADMANGASQTGRHWLRPLEHALETAKGRPRSRFGETTKALQQLGTPAGPVGRGLDHPLDSRRDFVRRHHPTDDVPYRQAKRKLKLALAEYYRGLELLKSYALLNRTAFRKLNKKYDKTVQARPTGRYVAERVSRAWFVRSAVLDGHMHAVEDLYARYFERGSHKVAVGKLRSKGGRAGVHHGSVYRNGCFLGAGVVLGLQGVVDGARMLSDPDPVTRVRSSYLLQIYAGYFLALLLFLLFCLDCWIWSAARINYAFIFEFDTRHSLDWRQLAELPCFFLFLEGLLLWINFQDFGAGRMFVYWPVVLIGLTVLILFFPAKALYHRSRWWWLYSNWRLLFAGIYPVEFRDFLLGDMYCSQTYAMGVGVPQLSVSGGTHILQNLELFFCLYAQHWADPGRCNSRHSRLLGFFTTLPGIWRLLQCLRRYRDTRNVFPHLVNGGKYTFTVLFYLSLSLYRIDTTPSLRALFIFCATVNSVYCSVWDVAMDWSLGNPYAHHPLLRDVLGYRRAWVYYGAMVIDPLLRFNWLFYVAFAGELQHSAALSFAVALSEVLRRGVWALFRVENEHCTNVGRFRASRDVPLPYSLETTPPSTATLTSAAEQPSATPSSAPAPATRVPTQQSSAGSASTLRRRGPRARPSHEDSPVFRGIARVGTIMAEAHAQDFERRRPSQRLADPDASCTKDAEHTSDDDDDDDDTEGDEEVGRVRAGDVRGAEREGAVRESERDARAVERLVEEGRGGVRRDETG